MGERSVTLVKRLTAQDFITKEVVCLASGIRLSQDCEFPEIVPNDYDWWGRDEEGHTYPVSWSEKYGWTI